MTRSQAALALVLLSPLAVAGLAGCAPEAPAQPSYSADVRPLLLARCVRCHDSPMRRDPNMDPPIGIAPYTLNYPVLDPTIEGLALAMANAVKGLLAPGVKAMRPMPPLPAEPLADWEIKVFENFAAEMPKKP